MKHLLISISLVVFLLASTSFAQDSLQVQNRKQFHQNKQQHSLMKTRQGQGAMGFIDENGDGYNDNAPDADGDGIPNGMDPDFVRPQDGSGRMNGQRRGHRGNGSGIGAGNGSGIGSGNCDGTGPKGKRGGK